MTEGNTGDIILKAAPDCMREQAHSVAEQISAMTDAFEELAAVTSRTSHYWIGEAGDHYRTLYEESKEEVRTILKRLTEHPGQLMMAAQICEEETQDEMLPNPLPGDIIS